MGASVQLTTAAEEKAKKLLFIGNSYTYGNSLPLMVKAMMESQKLKTEVKMLARGGFTLATHLNEQARGNGNLSCKRVIEKGWDFVVLQDQSSRPTIGLKETIRDIKIFNKIIKPTKAQPILFMTWGYNHDPQEYKEMTFDLAVAYCKASKATGIPVAPVGLAWQHCRKANPMIQLHQNDQSHPTAAGSYLTACVFYQVITGKSPIGLPTKLKDGNKGLVSLDKKIATAIQKAAFKSVDDFIKNDGPERLLKAEAATKHAWNKFEGKLHNKLTPEDVVKAFGKPSQQGENGEVDTFIYELDDGQSLWLVFNGGMINLAKKGRKRIELIEK